MRVVLIDNYDSFTFNLYQLLARVNGEEPVVVKNDDPQWSTAHLDDFDAVVISPGPGHPAVSSDLGHSAAVIQAAKKPVLGVCLGHQALGHLFGGVVSYAPREMHGRLSAVTHDGRELFEGIPSPFNVVRYHSLAVTELPEELVATAWSNDGVVMGVRHRELPMWGVQFHPESILTEHGERLLRNFRNMVMGNSSAPTVETFSCSQWVEPAAVFSALFSDVDTAFWLDSSDHVPGDGRVSVMADGSGPNAELITYDAETRKLNVRANDGSRSETTESLFAYLSERLSERRVPEHDHAFQFQLGYVGYLGYELKNDGCQDVVHESPLPDANLLFVDRALVFDHDRNQLHALAYACSSQDRESNRQWFEYVEMMLGAITPRDSLAVVDVSSPTRGEPEFRRAKSRYLSDIQTCLERIHDGESYEVCLTNMLELPSLQDPLAVYEALRLHNPTPFGTFMRFPGVDILSSSPERFLHVDTARRVEAKPVKGTVRRGVDAEEDERLKMTLRSEKEEAENLMIVDLLRNDLGKVCEVGSVTVPKLFAIETFSTVHQLVSTVRGVLRPDESAVSCVAAAFPGGSMTGAPKVRTMSIIDEIESGPRGIYSGAIGYFSLNGSADWSIVIRTIVNTPAHATIGVGGAITALSDPEMEFEEIVLKAQGVLGAIAQGDGSIRTEHVGLPSA